MISKYVQLRTATAIKERKKNPCCVIMWTGANSAKKLRGNQIVSIAYYLPNEIPEAQNFFFLRNLLFVFQFLNFCFEFNYRAKSLCQKIGQFFYSLAIRDRMKIMKWVTRTPSQFYLISQLSLIQICFRFVLSLDDKPFLSCGIDKFFHPFSFLRTYSWCVKKKKFHCWKSGEKNGDEMKHKKATEPAFCISKKWNIQRVFCIVYTYASVDVIWKLFQVDFCK